MESFGFRASAFIIIIIFFFFLGGGVISGLGLTVYLPAVWLRGFRR